MKEFCFVIPRIDACNFTYLRDGQTANVKQVKNKILGIKKNMIMNMEELETKLAEEGFKTQQDNSQQVQK